MTNPYSFGALGERAAGVGKAIPPSQIDKGLIKVDHVKWAVDQLGLDGDDGAIQVTWDSPMVWKTGDTGSDLFVAIWIDKTNSVIRIKLGTGSAPTPSSETDGDAILTGSTGSSPTF